MNLIDTVRLVLKQKGQNVWAVSPEACVYDAIEIMAEKYVGALMVVYEGKLVGVVSERDYARKVILQGRSSKETQVKEIMTSPAIFVTPDQTVENRYSPEQFAAQARNWVEMGVQVVGGCCGYGPQYIRPLRDALPEKIAAPRRAMAAP